MRSSSRRRISGWAKSSNTTSANGGPSPQRQRLLQTLPRSLKLAVPQRRPAGGDARREQLAVQLGALEPEQIAAGDRVEHERPATADRCERLAQSPHRHLQSLARADITVAPQRVDQRISGNGAVRFNDEQREQRNLARTTELHPPLAVPHLDRTEYPNSRHYRPTPPRRSTRQLPRTPNIAHPPSTRYHR